MHSEGFIKEGRQWHGGITLLPGKWSIAVTCVSFSSICKLGAEQRSRRRSGSVRCVLLDAHSIAGFSSSLPINLDLGVRPHHYWL